MTIGNDPKVREFTKTLPPLQKYTQGKESSELIIKDCFPDTYTSFIYGGEDQDVVDEALEFLSVEGPIVNAAGVNLDVVINIDQTPVFCQCYQCIQRDPSISRERRHTRIREQHQFQIT